MSVRLFIVTFTASRPISTKAGIHHPRDGVCQFSKGEYAG